MAKGIQKDNLYREITDKIIAELERDIVPWVQPWSRSKQSCTLGLPVNGLTRRSYSGINILLLWSALEERGFASPYWLTFKQCIAMGGSVRKGEHGTQVYFADKFVPQKEQQRAKDEGTDPSTIHFLKRYTVFNAEQCEGLAMAETLACGTATAEAVAMTTSATLNDWRPDDIFFDLLAGKDVVQAMLADIASPAVADGNRSETTKVQKGIIKDFLHGTNGREHKIDWLPPYFQFPPKAYTERGGTGCGDSWNKVAALFETTNT